MSSLTGQSLQQGKYTVEQELGRGGFGITYKARNNVLAQDVVIKTVNDSLRQDPQFLTHQSQFQDEARRLAKCFHPNIVRVTDFFTEAGLPYIVMDYIPGQTLDQLIEPGRPLTEARALEYIRQVGEAVEAIHRAGLLHRDIKPQNLILQAESQRVMLIDFGIAREFTPGITQAHTHLVSEGYAPIEQYLPQACRSQATDVYGLAATLYTLLTAQVPVAAVLRDRSPLAPPHEVQPTASSDVSAAVMQGMAVEPTERPKRVSDWLALLPASSGNSRLPTPPSQIATVVAAPRYRPTLPVELGTVTTPVHSSRFTPKTESAAPLQSRGRSSFSGWLVGAIALSIVVPFGLGYGLWRSQTSPSTPTADPPAMVPTPSAPPAVTEQPSPEDTTQEPSGQISNQPPSPQSETSSEDASEVAVPSAPVEPAPQAEPSVPEPPAPPADSTSEVQPNQPEPPLPTGEEARREEERAQEEERRQEERAREEEQREAEQEREEERHEIEKKPGKKGQSGGKEEI